MLNPAALIAFVFTPTVIVIFLVIDPDVIVIVAVPLAIAFTRPVLDTVATFLLELTYFRDCVEPAGTRTAPIFLDCPVKRLNPEALICVVLTSRSRTPIVLTSEAKPFEPAGIHIKTCFFAAGLAILTCAPED